MSDTPPARPSWIRDLLVSTLASSATALFGGFLIAVGNATAPYGLTMFIALPVVTGFVAGCCSRFFRAAAVSTLLSIVICFVLLLFTGLEGVVCIIMALPLIVIGALAGALVGMAVRQVIDSRGTLCVASLLGLSSLYAAGQEEERTQGPDRVETAVSSCVVSGSPQEVWERISRVDRLSAERPILLQIGLPVPKYCTLEGAGVGAKRVCHFDSGVIEEEITAWDPPNSFDVKITRTTLPGRHWLHFESASYRFVAVSPSQTEITRATTISSKLRPGWYWRRFEEMGIEAEHRYLFDSLTN
jgi:hypothetical protein